MPSLLLPIQPGTLPPGICYATEQARLVGFSEVQHAVLESGMAFYNFGDTKPAPKYQAYPWFRTIDGRWYLYSGNWISPRVGREQDTNTLELYCGTLTDLLTYDGGDTNPPTDRSGPMWEEATEFQGRSPMHPGAIAGSDPAKTLALDEDYGAGSLTQTVAQMPEHDHPPLVDNTGFWGHRSGGAGGTGNMGAGVDSEDMATTGLRGDGDPMNIVHPVRGIYLIRPTGRIYYLIP